MEKNKGLIVSIVGNVLGKGHFARSWRLFEQSKSLDRYRFDLMMLYINELSELSSVKVFSSESDFFVDDIFHYELGDYDICIFDLAIDKAMFHELKIDEITKNLKSPRKLFIDGIGLTDCYGRGSFCQDMVFVYPYFVPEAILATLGDQNYVHGIEFHPSPDSGGLENKKNYRAVDLAQPVNLVFAHNRIGFGLIIEMVNAFSTSGIRIENFFYQKQAVENLATPVSGICLVGDIFDFVLSCELQNIIVVSSNGSIKYDLANLCLPLIVVNPDESFEHVSDFFGLIAGSTVLHSYKKNALKTLCQTLLDGGVGFSCIKSGGSRALENLVQVMSDRSHGKN